MKKTTRLFIRIDEQEKRSFRKAARKYKNLSAFLLSAGRRAIKYHHLIEQADKLGLKTSKMKVVEL